jgi:uncharacterized protein with PIN domain
MSRGVLDASALLALLNQERGSEQIAAIITDKTEYPCSSHSLISSTLNSEKAVCCVTLHVPQHTACSLSLIFSSHRDTTMV